MQCHSWHISVFVAKQLNLGFLITTLTVGKILEKSDFWHCDMAQKYSKSSINSSKFFSRLLSY